MFLGIFSKEEEDELSYGDDSEERYRKCLVVANRYSIIQFGLCLFHKEEKAAASQGAEYKKKKRSSNSQDQKTYYIARPYSFYLFPRSG